MRAIAILALFITAGFTAEKNVQPAKDQEWVPSHVECMGLKEVLAEQKAEAEALGARHKSVLMAFLKKIDLEPIATIDAGKDPRESDTKKNQAISGFNNDLQRMKAWIESGDFNRAIDVISDNCSDRYRIGEDVKLNFHNAWIENYNNLKGKKFPNFARGDVEATSDKAALAKKKGKLTATLADGSKIE